METGAPIRLILMIGSNIFGVYALYRIVREVYFFIKNYSSDEEY